MLDQAHMTSLFENATEGIILTGAGGIITTVNPAAEKMFGYDKDELLGQPIEILIPDSFKAHHHKLRDGFYQHPSNRVMGHGRDLFGRKKNGDNLAVEVSLSHYQREGQLFVIAFIVDITQRKEIENNMLQQKEELEKVTDRIRHLNAELELKVEERTQILKEALQRLEESQLELSEALDKEKQLNEIKSRFVSMASHEFRTPLTTVLSSASLLSRYTTTEDQGKRDKHIERIKSSVDHLNDILEDFLSLGKLNEGRVEMRPQQTCLTDVLQDVVEEMKGQVRSGQHIELQCEPDLQVNSDKKLLRNVLVNLISNAIKFSGEDKPIYISALAEKDIVRIIVKDEGLGISADDQLHLFTSFFRGANVTNIQGTGLGLHIVKRYVDLLGGEVNLESELNKGTTVTIFIPAN
jgi:PAS domain S-box-containing protein